MAWGSRTFILGGYVEDVSAAALDAFVAHVEHVPGDASISVTAMGGAIGRVADDATAFTGRTVPFDVSPDSGWSDPALDEANADWASGRWRSSRRTCCPAATSTSSPMAAPR